MSDLAPLIEQLAVDAPDISRWLFGSLLAKAHVEGDGTDDARRLLEEFAAADFDLPQDQIWMTGKVDFAEAAIECRDPKYAAPLFDRLAPWADQLPATGASALGPGPSQSLSRRTRHCPRPLRPGGRLLRPIGRDERPDGCDVLRRPDRTPVGKDAR
jgi:hypothetical protein